VPKACPSCGAPYLLVRDRKAGAFYVCDKEGCGFDAPAADLEAYAFVAKVPDAAAVAAAAAAAAEKKKKPAAKRARKS
jgi:DNA-directed RNA polymerase subunit M/transcription elongation factor TFIIS